MAFPQSNDAGCTKNGGNRVIAGCGIAAVRRLSPGPRQRRREDQERERQPAEPFAHHAPVMAATSPAMLNVVASTVGSNPNSRSVAVVIGPMLASFTFASLVL